MKEGYRLRVSENGFYRKYIDPTRRKSLGFGASKYVLVT
jgi:hypothetical protein